MPKKKGAGPTENGLVSKPLPKHKSSQVTSNAHLHENERQITRNIGCCKRMVQVDIMPQLKLAPPTVYHEKVKKGVAMLQGESSNGRAKIEKTKTGKQSKNLKTKGSTGRFSLKSNIFDILLF
ncbi:uncharacterized protein [Rutidosis leptorrhynchoides]|uniref:uncharacterized protein isoform X2 n=1 Tax=Rutidosis leptorrhynchoides TaxID=125765 RepID=UPI003A998C1D